MQTVLHRWAPRRQARWLRAGLWGAVILVMSGGGPAIAEPSLGLSPCALLPSPPAPSHPVRKAAAFATAFRGLEGSGADPRRNGNAARQFEAARGRLFAEAERAFRVRGEDITDFDPGPARRFLTRHVFISNASVVIGLDGFELAPEVLAAWLVAACWGDRLDAVLPLAEVSPGAEGSPLRAGAALLHLFGGGQVDLSRLEGLAIASESFLETFVLAEIALRGQRVDEATALHARARTLIRHADAQEAWARQGRRLAALTEGAP